LTLGYRLAATDYNKKRPRGIYIIDPGIPFSDSRPQNKIVSILGTPFKATEYTAKNRNLYHHGPWDICRTAAADDMKPISVAPRYRLVAEYL